MCAHVLLLWTLAHANDSSLAGYAEECLDVYLMSCMCDGCRIQVSVPPGMAYQMVALAAATFGATYAWDHALREAFPAPRPPQKGHLAFPKELAALQREQPEQEEPLQDGAAERPHLE
jgi:hypothetical protein